MMLPLVLYTPTILRLRISFFAVADGEAVVHDRMICLLLVLSNEGACLRKFIFASCCYVWVKRITNDAEKFGSDIRRS